MGLLMVSIPIAYHVLTFSLHLLTNCLPFPYHFLTICLLVARCAELTARCEGSRFGVACGFLTNCLPFPYQVLTNSLPNHRHRPTEMFSEHRWRVAVLPNMVQNGQIGALIFPYEFLLQIVSFLTSGGPAYTAPNYLPPAP